MGFLERFREAQGLSESEVTDTGESGANPEQTFPDDSDDNNDDGSSSSGGAPDAAPDPGDSFEGGSDESGDSQARTNIDVNEDEESDPEPETGTSQGAGGMQETRSESTPEAETDAPEPTKAEQDSFSGQTARLETAGSQSKELTATVGGETVTGTEREIAQKLEDEVAGQQVTELVDGLRQTGADLREKDVSVVRTESGGIGVQLSEVGRKRIDAIADRQAEEQVEQRLERRFDEKFTDEDVTVQSDGDVEVSQDVRDEATEQQIAAENEGISERNVEVTDGEPRRTNESPDEEVNRQAQAAEQVESELGLERGEDFTVERTAPATRVPTEEGQGVTVRLTEEGAEELRAEQLQNEGDSLTGPVQEFESVTGVDLPGSTSEAGEAREQRAETPNGELFGGSSAPERALRDASRQFRTNVVEPSGELGSDVATSGPADVASGINPISTAQAVATDSQAREQFREALAADDLSDLDELGGFTQGPSETTRSRAGEGIAEGGTALLNAPGLAVTGVEAGEFTLEGLQSTNPGGETPDEFAERAAGGAAIIATRTATAARENPVKLAGQVAGSAVTGAGAIRAARAAGGPRAARTTGFLVDPAEDIRKRLGITPGGRSDSSGVDAESADAETISRFRQSDFLSDDRGQADLSFGGSKSRSDAETESSIDSDEVDQTISAEEIIGTRQSPDAELDARRKPDQDLRDAAERSEMRTQNAGMDRRQNTMSDAGPAGLVLAQQAQQREVQTTEPVSEVLERLDTSTRVDTGLRSGLREELRTEARTTNRAESRLLERAEVRANTNTNARTRGRTRVNVNQDLNTNLETRTRVRARTRANTNVNTRVRSDVDVDDDESERFEGVDGDADLFDKQIINPVTKPGNVASRANELSGIDLEGIK